MNVSGLEKVFRSKKLLLLIHCGTLLLLPLPETTKQRTTLQPCTLSHHKLCYNDAVVCKYRLRFLNAIPSNYVPIKITKMILLKCARG